MQNMLRNNQMFQRLGVGALAQMVNSAKPKVAARADSGTLYEPEPEDDNEGVVEKVYGMLRLIDLILAYPLTYLVNQTSLGSNMNASFKVREAFVGTVC